jgi:hypothetical protein
VSPLRFEPDTGTALGGSLVFSEGEHSFRFEPGSVVDLSDRTGDAGATSASVGTLQIELDVKSGVVLFVWGLHPRTLWATGSALPSDPREGTVRVVPPSSLVSGVALNLASVGEWETVQDPSTGWIRVRRDEAPDDEEVLVATGTILGLASGRLNSVWLQPVFVD